MVVLRDDRVALAKIKETLRPLDGFLQHGFAQRPRYVPRMSGKAFVLNEGDAQVNPGGPYQISYGSIVPKSDECQTFGSCLRLSSHIAFGSIRMEPVFMILGSRPPLPQCFPSKTRWPCRTFL